MPIIVDEQAAAMDREATAFAMELLMPYDWLMADLQAMDPPLDFEHDDRIAALARRYQVSEQLMLSRIGGLMAEATQRRYRRQKK